MTFSFTGSRLLVLLDIFQCEKSPIQCVSFTQSLPLKYKSLTLCIESALGSAFSSLILSQNYDDVDCSIERCMMEGRGRFICRNMMRDGR